MANAQKLSIQKEMTDKTICRSDSKSDSKSEFPDSGLQIDGLRT